MNKEIEECNKLHLCRNIYNTVLSLLEDVDKGFLLDLGCGNGILADKIHSLGFDVSACNIDTSIASNIFSDIKYKQADLNNNLPYADNQFDVIIAIDIIEHLENPWHLFREVNRVLKKDGYFIMSTANIDNVWSRLRFFVGGNLQTFDKCKLSDVSDPDDRGHITIIPLWLVKNMFRKIPFNIEKITYNRGAFSYVMGYKFKLIQKILLTLPKWHIFGEEIFIVMRNTKHRVFDNLKEFEKWWYHIASSEEMNDFDKFNEQYGIIGEMPLKKKLSLMQKNNLVKIKEGII